MFPAAVNLLLESLTNVDESASARNGPRAVVGGHVLHALFVHLLGLSPVLALARELDLRPGQRRDRRGDEDDPPHRICQNLSSFYNVNLRDFFAAFTV